MIHYGTVSPRSIERSEGRTPSYFRQCKAAAHCSPLLMIASCEIPAAAAAATVSIVAALAALRTLLIGGGVAQLR